jgi:hypothetical protein
MECDVCSAIALADRLMEDRWPSFHPGTRPSMLSAVRQEAVESNAYRPIAVRRQLCFEDAGTGAA